MRRRVTIAIVATTTAALVLVALMTVLAVNLRARTDAIDRVENRAPEVAESLVVTIRRLPDTNDRQATIRGLLAAVTNALDVTALDVAIVETDAPITASLPYPVTSADIEAIGDRETVSFIRDDMAVALSARPLNRSRALVVVITDEVSADIGPLGGWFLAASAVVLVLSLLTARRLTRVVTAPLHPIASTTRRLARGDLDTRVQLDESWPDEMADLASSVNVMADSLQRGRALEQQFLMSVSHDLRTPLTSIRGFAEALRDGTAADDPLVAERAATVIVAQSERLERLVADLLELARLDSHQFGLEMRSVDLGHLISTTTGGFAPIAVDAGLDLSVTIDPGPPMIADVDPDRFAQAIANLVENATKYASERIEVHVGRVAGTIDIAVHDDGPGIAEQDLPHVFERLYVAKRTPTRTEVGSGLGLAITRQLAVAMGGKVEASRSHLGGACLAVRLPESP